MRKLGEFARIERVRKMFSGIRNRDRGPGRLHQLGIGDDAAVIPPDYLVTTDALVDGVHFLSGRVAFRDLGWKSLAVNISDIAAMGGYPLYALLVMAIPSGLPDKKLDNYLSGLKTAARKYSVELIGGDTVRSPVLAFTITVIGRPFKKPVLRGGARAGDSIYVTGTFGDSAVGLELIRKKLKYPVKDPAYFLKRHDRPEPRVEPARRLVTKHEIHSCIDVSDGLLADLGHIADESRVGFSVDLDKIPVAKNRIGPSFQRDPRYFLDLAAGGGEDYELIFTSPDRIRDQGVTKIGTIPADRKKRTVIYQNRVLPVRSIRAGFSHF